MEHNAQLQALEVYLLDAAKQQEGLLSLTHRFAKFLSTANCSCCTWSGQQGQCQLNRPGNSALITATYRSCAGGHTASARTA